MEQSWQPHPWTTRFRDAPGFGLQVFPIDTPDQPSKHLLEAGKLAEELGFDAFFVSDHPGWAFECWVHLSALAVLTTRIRLGSVVNCVFYRHPVMAARITSDVDNISDGRVIVGLGNGWDANEFAKLGMPFPAARERQLALLEAIEILNGAWGSDPFTYHGQFFSTEQATVTPPPVQQPRPPIMIAGGGEQVTLRHVARYADACNLVDFGVAGGAPTPDDIRRKLTALERHCDEIGRPYDSILRTHLTGWLVLAENRADLKRKLDRYFPEGVGRRFSGEWEHFVIAATPDEAVAYYQARRDAGIQYFIVELLDAADTETIHLLAERVVPKISACT